MVSEQQIIQKLKIIDQYKFEWMISNLFNQGAFPEIVGRNASIVPYGVSIEKERTRKSFPRSDAELITGEVKIESSVQVDWKSKFIKDIEKNKGKLIKKFVFCTNQDISSGEIKIDGKKIDANEYCRNNLNCKECFVVSQKQLILILQNPAFFFIRRNFLNIPEDFFCSVEEYKSVLKKNNSLVCNVSKSKIKLYANILSNKLTFDHKKTILLNNDDYITLLHTIAIWASMQVEKYYPKAMSQDLCFIKWPYSRVNLDNMSIIEINDKIPTILFIWGAHEIENLYDFRIFNKQNVMLVFIYKSAFRDQVHDKLRDFGSLNSIQDLYISEIDEREISTKERERHRHKINTVVRSLTDRLLKCEALIYFYSPFYTDDPKLKNKIGSILKINQTQLNQLFKLLLQNNFASKIGEILWLKQPIIAKELLNDYINDGTFNIEEMVI